MEILRQKRWSFLKLFCWEKFFVCCQANFQVYLTLKLYALVTCNQCTGQFLPISARKGETNILISRYSGLLNVQFTWTFTYKWNALIRILQANEMFDSNCKRVESLHETITCLHNAEDCIGRVRKWRFLSPNSNSSYKIYTNTKTTVEPRPQVCMQQ